MDLLLATHNKHKQKEFELLAAPKGIHILSLDDIGLGSLDIPETGTTFEENAMQKVQQVAKHCRLPIIADDSGICVDALDGSPGVYSARYAPGSDADRCRKLLDALAGVTDRRAHFVCVIAYQDADSHPIQLFRGEVFGSIVTDTPENLVGFGYDPIFLPDGYDAVMQDLGEDIKNSISHRARAMQQFFAQYV